MLKLTMVPLVLTPFVFVNIDFVHSERATLPGSSCFSTYPPFPPYSYFGVDSTTNQGRHSCFLTPLIQYLAPLADLAIIIDSFHHLFTTTYNTNTSWEQAAVKKRLSTSPLRVSNTLSKHEKNATVQMHGFPLTYLFMVHDNWPHHMAY